MYMQERGPPMNVKLPDKLAWVNEQNQGILQIREYPRAGKSRDRIR